MGDLQIGDVIHHKQPYPNEPKYMVAKFLNSTEIAVARIRDDGSIWDNGWHHKDVADIFKFYHVEKRKPLN